MGVRTVTKEEVVNSMIPIWQRSKKEASDADCIAFYKEKFKDTEDPVSVIRVNAEGTVSYRAMLFVPAKAPYDYYTRDYVPGLRLYSNGVMIMEKCPDLLPECFRFVRGIVDSPDLSLNISREMLQHDRQLKLISMNLEKKIKGELSRLMECDREKYEKFFNVFGTQLKYGIIGDYGMKRDLLTDLLLYRSAEEGKARLPARVCGRDAGKPEIHLLRRRRNAGARREAPADRAGARQGLRHSLLLDRCGRVRRGDPRQLCREEVLQCLLAGSRSRVRRGEGRRRQDRRGV